MTVKELIDALSNTDPEAIVRVEIENKLHYISTSPAANVKVVEYDHSVWISGEEGLEG